MALAITCRPLAMRRAEANRAANGAIPSSDFSGLPGETKSQTWSSARQRRASAMT
jgi:hypothetical protein